MSDNKKPLRETLKPRGEQSKDKTSQPKDKPITEVKADADSNK